LKGFQRIFRPGVGSCLGVLVAVGLASGGPAGAEESRSAYSQTVDLAVGTGPSKATGAVSWNHFRGFGHSQRVKVGLGLRLASLFGGQDLAYSTADAELIGQNKINTLKVSDARTHSLNLEFQIKYRFLRKVEAGFDIDMIGVGFGPARTAKYVSGSPGFSGPQRAEVSSFDLLEGGKPDRGQLDSEFFLGYWWSERWAIRAGYSHFRSEYTTARPLDFANDRYRHERNLGLVAVTFRPWHFQ
jgi:hypothetical protein